MPNFHRRKTNHTCYQASKRSIRYFQSGPIIRDRVNDLKCRSGDSIFYVSWLNLILFFLKKIQGLKNYGAYLNRRYSFPRSTKSAKLPHDNTKAEDVTFFCEWFIANELRSHPLWSPRRWVVIHWGVRHYSREPKITYLDCPVFVNKAICTLEITVNNL